MDALDFEILDPDMQAVFGAVLAEFDRATEKHPNWPTELWRQGWIVREEMGEVDRAILNYIEARDSGCDGCTCLKEENAEIDKEMVQVAAMAVRFLYHRRFKR